MPTAPVLHELPKSYVPAEHEGIIGRRWEDAGAFHAEPGEAGGSPPFCILIPPPNVTAPLHLGQAFNNTLQDVLVRVHRMRGFNTLWMPGTDHAGIATQTVVEKRLLVEGQRRRDMGRAAFVARVQKWKDEYEATITEQLKRMGASCDWERQRFTMDAGCAKAVRTAFFRLFRDGLIVRRKRLVNWDPVTLTALADDEVDMREVAGHFWYLEYPIVDAAGTETGESVTVATTRPETMLGDTAVAVNPNDPERARFVGRSVRLPIVGRIVPVIADDYVAIPDPDSDDPKARFASGFLKVTPAHDPNDWMLGERHGLPVVNVMAPDASISSDHGWDDCPAEARAFLGLSREQARAAVVAWFAAHGRLKRVRDHTHAIGHSYRSHVPIEPYLSDQWYVRVTDDALVGEAQLALAAEQFDGTAKARNDGSRRGGDGGIRFFPARYAKVYQSWHEGLRDWCISRQLWWGHRIPVWHRRVDFDGPVPSALAAAAADPACALHLVPTDGGEAAGTVALDERHGEHDVYVCRLEDTDWKEGEAQGFAHDPDVLDTWFSSALWPLSTMGWPDPASVPGTAGLLETFNPSSVLCTAREIITLWVSRMVMFNRYFRDGHLPFREVYIHAMIQDGHGQKMSKSLGNGVDPRDIIDNHGADALRFTLVQMATTTQDVRLPVDTLCPACEAAFHPPERTIPAGYRVAEPEMTCPECRQVMTSGYGLISGTGGAEGTPLARNTSNRFDHGRNFANKLWNAARFALRNLDAGGGDPALATAGLPLVDRWIINRLRASLLAVETALAQYQFSVYADTMHEFIWRDFCDWYLEAIKPTIRESAAQQQVLRTILNAALRMLHPVCPFITEALWPSVQAAGAAGVEGIELPNSDLLTLAAWPIVAAEVHDEESSATFERVKALVSEVRGLRARHPGPSRRPVRLWAPPAVVRLAAAAGGVVEALAGIERIDPLTADRPAGSIPLAFEGTEFFVGGLVEAVDAESERRRLAGLIATKEAAVSGYRSKLANPDYVNNAPPAVVAETRDRQAEAEADLAAARRSLAALRETGS